QNAPTRWCAARRLQTMVSTTHFTQIFRWDQLTHYTLLGVARTESPTQDEWQAPSSVSPSMLLFAPSRSKPLIHGAKRMKSAASRQAKSPISLYSNKTHIPSIQPS